MTPRHRLRIRPLIRLTGACAAVVLLAAPDAGAQKSPEARRVTIAEAIAIALDHSPDVGNGQARVDEAESNRAAARGGFGPKLHVDANLQQYSSPFQIGLGGGSTFTVREAFTWTAAVSLIQPITPLFAIYDQYKVQALGVDIAAIERAATRRAVELAVVEGYYRLLEARRLSEVADASVTQLEAQERQARSLFGNGVIGKNDLLRSSLALAGARQRAIQTQGQIELARGQLALAMGVSDEEPFEPIPFDGDPPPISEPSIPAAERHAVASRLELRELDERIRQTEKTVGYAKAALIPQVNAVGNYTHTEGSPFAQLNAAYVGLLASWDVWDWGSNVSHIGEAQARLRQARLARTKADDEVKQEARRAFVNATTAREALAVARVAVAQAEENYRIVTKKFENAAATSFDQVDAEALLTQARGQIETGLYDLLIAEVALDGATGAPLVFFAR
jgi:outer membrane protein